MQVITKQVDGHKLEPYEEAVIEVPEEHVGPVVDMLGQRKGQMLDLVAGTDTTSLTRSQPASLPFHRHHLFCQMHCALSSAVYLAGKPSLHHSGTGTTSFTDIVRQSLLFLLV